MPTIVYKNAIILINGAEVHASLNEFAAMYAAEMLDETTFGDDTRINKGGLKRGSMNGKGFFDSVIGAEQIVFQNIGFGSQVNNPAYQSGSIVEDTILLCFPDGVTEGATTVGMGYAMKTVMEKFQIGGAVGIVTPIEFGAQSRGIEA